MTTADQLSIVNKILSSTEQAYSIVQVQKKSRFYLIFKIIQKRNLNCIYNPEFNSVPIPYFNMSKSSKKLFLSLKHF